MNATVGATVGATAGAGTGSRARQTRRVVGKTSTVCASQRAVRVYAGREGDKDENESDWMQKARATANKRAAEFRKERGAQPGAPAGRRYNRAGRDEDRARTAAMRGYEMDDDGNYMKPEPGIEELLRDTAWEMDPTRDVSQFSMTKDEWKTIKLDARAAVYPHDAVKIFENAGLRRISPDIAASMLKLIAQKAQHSRCDREELAGLRRDPRVAHLIGTCVAAARSTNQDLLAPDSLSKSCWALGVISGERANSAELEVLSNRAASMMDKLSSDEIADIAWSLAISRHASDRFFQELDIHAAMHGMKGFQAYQITTIAWAFAHLGHKHAGFLDGLDVWVTRAPARKADMSPTEAAVSQVHRFNATILASLAWSFCVMEDALDSLFFKTLWAEIVHRGEHDAEVVHKHDASASTDDEHHNDNVFGPWKGRQLNMLHQAALTATRAGFAPLPAELGQAADKAWNTQHRPPVVSWFQRDVGAILSYMGEKYEEEAVVSGYRCDLLLPAAKPNGVVIEVDGPSHFARNDRERPLGQTRLKQRQLEGENLGVFSIPIFEWDCLEDAQQKSDYLRAGLDAIERGEKPARLELNVELGADGDGNWNRRPMGQMGGDFTTTSD